MEVTIHIDGSPFRMAPGLVSADVVVALANCDESRIFLSRDSDIDVPLSPSDHILIHGDENFVIGDAAIECNPPLRRPVCPEFNGSHALSLASAKIDGKTLKTHDDKFPSGRLFADIDGGVDAEISDSTTLLVQDRDSYFVIPQSDAGPVDIEECGKHDRRPPKGYGFRLRVDQHKFIVESEKATGSEILALVEKDPDEWALNQKLHGGTRLRIKAHDTVDLAQPGIERFETVRLMAQQG